MHRPLALVAALGAGLAASSHAVAEEAASIDAVRAVFERTYPERCEQGIAGVLAEVEPEIHTVSYIPYEDANVEFATVYGLACFAGAYNVGSVWFVADRYGGISPVAFARPTFEFTFADEEETVVASHEVTGMTADLMLINATYDPGSQTIVASGKWRGLGDASDIGFYAFVAGNFVLQRYMADPTYDGEIGPFVTLYSASGG